MSQLLGKTQLCSVPGECNPLGMSVQLQHTAHGSSDDLRFDVNLDAGT